jgi:hypothetical protein
MGQRKGPSGANAPPVHGIKKCLDYTNMHLKTSETYKSIKRSLLNNVSSILQQYCNVYSFDEDIRQR